MDDAARLEPLADAVVQSSAARLGRVRDEAAQRARAIVAEAEDRLAELESAAREIGRVRGQATESAYERDADEEIEAVVAGAFDRLFERFQQRVRLALESLPEDEEAYARALTTWAQRAAAAMPGPSEVFAAPRDREPLYEALLAAGADDFRVLVERTTRAGFVVRDLDGRTVFDCRPAALVDADAGGLRALLQEAVPETPASHGERGTDR